MITEYESLILALDSPFQAKAHHSQSSEAIPDVKTEYGFHFVLDSIERPRPVLIHEKDDSGRGQVIHGTLLPQSVFEEAKLGGSRRVSINCPKSWNLRLWLWKKYGGEQGAEIDCIGSLAESSSRQNIQTVPTKITGCYSVIAYLGIMLLLSPIIAVVWPAALFGKHFFHGLILLLAARGATFVWPNLIPDVKTLDISLVTYVLLGGFFKFYWWAINLGSDDESSDEYDEDDPSI